MKKNKKYLVVTGGSGFVGSNLINYLILKTKFNIISIDDYSSGSKKNEQKNKRITYIKGNTSEINKILGNKANKIHSLFHFGEFSRIYQSFVQMDKCIQSNTIGTNEVFKFCLKNNIKLIYSATSASLGNSGNDKNLSPYSFSKTQNLEFLENLKKWFNFKFEVIFFYNVYGPGQIKTGKMATVIGIFEDHFLKKKSLPVVRPGSQSRRFTHIQDTIEVCYLAWKKNRCKYYSITNTKSYKILQVAKMFSNKIRLLPPRKGERFASSLTKLILSNKILRFYGKIDLKDYVRNLIKNEHKF
ncbi:NAD-dependent epimerase/dehydratase family protein [Candidatus Pelagibacter communis]|uniref:NAD-dependent epimerase/dehydratase family protein n=1 Tax=Candidatus Pelagibacter TaxID=198251 RepID=UPI003EE1AD0A